MKKVFEMVGRTKFQVIDVKGIAVRIEQIKRARAGSRSCERVRRIVAGNAVRTTFLVSNFSGIPGFHVYAADADLKQVHARKGAMFVAKDLEDAAKFCMAVCAPESI